MHAEHKPTSIDELKQYLQAMNKALPASTLHNLCDGIQDRVKQGNALDVGRIGMKLKICVLCQTSSSIAGEIKHTGEGLFVL